MITALDRTAGSVGIDFGDRRPEFFPVESTLMPPPIHVAAWVGDPDDMRACLRRGDDTLEKDKEGLLAIEVAVRRGHASVAELLHKHAVDSGLDEYCLSASPEFHERLSLLLGCYNVVLDTKILERECTAAGLQYPRQRSLCREARPRDEA